MSRQDNDRQPSVAPMEPTDSRVEVPRSGAGAGTALSAMLRKRQMRVTRDAESDGQPPASSVRKTAND
jgi:hypothetical protein